MIVVASIPRSGSTYLVRSIAGLSQAGNSPPDLEERYGIRKTHRPPEFVEWEGVDRAIFLFGDVAASVSSTKLWRWGPGHFENCGRAWDPTAPIFDEDVLGYEEIWDGWTRGEAPPVPTLAVRYETLPENRDAVEELLGGSVPWLPWRSRRTHPHATLRERIEDAYARLVDKIDAAPDAWRVG